MYSCITIILIFGLFSLLVQCPHIDMHFDQNVHLQVSKQESVCPLAPHPPPHHPQKGPFLQFIHCMYSLTSKEQEARFPQLYWSFLELSTNCQFDSKPIEMDINFRIQVFVCLPLQSGPNSWSHQTLQFDGTNTFYLLSKFTNIFLDLALIITHH